MRAARLAFWMLILSSLGTATLTAQVPADLREAMTARRQAVATADAGAWNKLTTDDFTVVTPDGHLLTKAERLAQMRQLHVQTVAVLGEFIGTPAEPRSTPTVEQEHITRYGESFVHRFRADGTWILEVWVRDAGAWRVAAAQETVAAQMTARVY
jgi:hypothetical protein